MVAGRHNLTRRAVLGVGAAACAIAATGTGDAAAVRTGEASAPASDSPPRPAPGIEMLCGDCGGNNVSRDAWADWDTEAQDWVLGAVFDHAHCHDCDGETRLEEVSLLLEGTDDERTLGHGACEE